MTVEEEVSDGELARLAAGGDRASFALLVERHYDFIYRIAWRLMGHRADAEDVAQEVCVRLGRSISGYRGGSGFTTWLYAIVVNAVRDNGRKQARDVIRTRAFTAQALVDGAVASDDDAEETAESLWRAVRQLPPKQAQSVTLVYGEAMNHAQAADLMGCSEATVSWHIHEAKKRLRTLVRAGEA